MVVVVVDSDRDVIERRGSSIAVVFVVVVGVGVAVADVLSPEDPRPLHT